MRAVDVQGLAGAYTLGVARAGFDIIAKFELPGGFGIANVETNHHLLGDFPIEEGPQESWERLDDVQYVFGNPPCSGFSLMNTSKRGNARGPGSKINDCMWAFAEYVGTMRHAPEFAAFESVQGAFTQGRELMQQLRDHVQVLQGRQHRYRLTHLLLSGATAGAASVRNRYFWVIHRVPFGVDVKDRERPATYRDAIGDLVGLDSETWDPQPTLSPPSSWLKSWNMHRPDGHVDAHAARNLSQTNAMWLKRYNSVMDWWQPGEIYEKALQRAIEEEGEAPGPWREGELEYKIENNRFGFSQPRRVIWDKQAYVITGGGPGQFVHPEENRFLTIRELARIQGFPDTWNFDGAGGRINLAGLWIGKGVPVQSGNFTSEWVKNSIMGNPGSITGEKIGDDEYKIDITHHWKTWVK